MYIYISGPSVNEKYLGQICRNKNQNTHLQ